MRAWIFFDTAEIYGNGHSERVVGELVHAASKQVVVATEYAPLPWRFSSGSVGRALEKRLKRLIQRLPEANGVLDACKELNVTLIAYSPLGRGVLSGKYRPGSSVSEACYFYPQF
jgi:aryl-alcohol dehydrogenase-like predicted oxidoreductase